VDDLSRYIRQAESSLSRQKSVRPSCQGVKELNDDERGLERLEHCTKWAQCVLWDASTVVADSQPVNPDHHESHISPAASDYQENSDKTHTVIEDWIPRLKDVEETIPLSESPITAPALDSQSPIAPLKDTMSEATLTILSSDSQTQFNEPPTLKTNFNQDSELFWIFVRKGDEKYKSKKYAEAERYYRGVLDRSRRLQIGFDKDDVITKLGIACFEQRKWDQAQSYFHMVPRGNDKMLERLIQTGNEKLDMHDREAACAHFERALAMSTDLSLQTRLDLHLNAGIAYFKQEQWTNAKKHFLAVADVKPDGVLDLRCFEAEYYLAKIHVQENDLDGAEQRCLVASNGQFIMLGTSHASWHESIALLVEIYTAKGDPVEADAYAALLPEGYRSVSFSFLRVRTTIANNNSSINGR